MIKNELIRLPDFVLLGKDSPKLPGDPENLLRVLRLAFVLTKQLKNHFFRFPIENLTNFDKYFQRFC